jgi:hypothetical protein
MTDTSEPETRTSKGERLPGFHIHDLASFNAATTGNDLAIAGLYFFKELDDLVRLAWKIGDAFFDDPGSYQDVHGVGEALAQIHARYGTDERFPSDVQRDEIFHATFGSPGERTLPSGVSRAQETGVFPARRDVLLEAARAFAMRASDTGIATLRRSFLDAEQGMRSYLHNLKGDSINWSRQNTFGTITEKIGYEILRKVGPIFGTPPASTEFPYDIQDANGQKLVEKIWNQLVGNEIPILNQSRIGNLQLAALRGTEALAMIISYPESGDPDAVDAHIDAAYGWYTALCAVKGSATGAAPAPPTAMGSA